jgi:KipI family sensor histidine kinase inhibitor
VTTRPPVAHPLGDSAITISFGSERSADLLRRIHALAKSLDQARLPHVHDIVPAYLALTVFYDAPRATYQEMAAALLEFCQRVDKSGGRDAPVREHVIPVRYDGIDIESVAAATGLSAENVIARHTGRAYTVDLLGFVPGWAYLSELDPALQLPRRTQPRPRVAGGSVAIAAAQTGVYPLDTPGGWHIIGSTTTVMFDPTRDPPALLAPGDSVRFERIP